MQKSNNGRVIKYKGKQFSHDRSFMKKVVNDYLIGDETMNEVAIRYNVTVPQLRHWRSLFSPDLEQRTLIPAPMTEQEQKDFEALKKQNEELSKKLDYANLKVFGLQTMIEVAEEQFKIEIRKKPGTKPSAE